MRRMNLLKVIILVLISSGLLSSSSLSQGKPPEEYEITGKEKYVRKILYLGKWGTREGQFGYEPDLYYGHFAADWPIHIATDKESNIYVLDKFNHRVQKFSPQGKFLMAFGSKDDPNKYFENLWNIVVDLKGNIYISNDGQRRVIQFDPQGRFIREIPTEYPHTPFLSTDLQGNLYIDTYKNVKYDSQGNYLGEVEEFSNLVDVEGNYYLPQHDQNKKFIGIQRYNSKAELINEFRGLGRPRGVDLKGNFYTMTMKTKKISKTLPSGYTYTQEVEYPVYSKYDPQGNLLARFAEKDLPEETFVKVSPRGDVYLAIPTLPGWGEVFNKKGFYVIKYELKE